MGGTAVAVAGCVVAVDEGCGVRVCVGGTIVAVGAGVCVFVGAGDVAVAAIVEVVRSFAVVGVASGVCVVATATRASGTSMRPLSNTCVLRSPVGLL